MPAPTRRPTTARAIHPWLHTAYRPYEVHKVRLGMLEHCSRSATSALQLLQSKQPSCSTYGGHRGVKYSFLPRQPRLRSLAAVAMRHVLGLGSLLGRPLRYRPLVAVPLLSPPLAHARSLCTIGGVPVTREWSPTSTRTGAVGMKCGMTTVCVVASPCLRLVATGCTMINGCPFLLLLEFSHCRWRPLQKANVLKKLSCAALLKCIQIPL